MPIQILWGNDLNAQNTYIQKLINYYLYSLSKCL